MILKGRGADIQPCLKSAIRVLKRDEHSLSVVLFDLKVGSGVFAAFIDYLELNFLAFIERAKSSSFDCGDMNKYVLTSANRLNKAVAFCRIEPFHFSGRHCEILCEF